MYRYFYFPFYFVYLGFSMFLWFFILRFLAFNVGNFCVGGVNSRHTGWSSSDPARRRNSGPIANDGMSSRQKAPVPSDSTGSKDVMVSIYIYLWDAL